MGQRQQLKGEGLDGQRLTLGTLVVLEGLEGSERGTAGEELVRDAALIGRAVGVSLVVGVVRFTPAENHFE